MAQQRRSAGSSSGKSSGASWFLIVLLILIAAGFVWYQRQKRTSGYRIEGAAPGQVVSENHFSPAEDLEQIDLDRLEHAQHKLDIAMYAFTDRALAGELWKLAQRGVQVRVYRDGEQYENEQRNAQQHREDSVNDLLTGVRNIHVRVKPASRRDLMHLKAYAYDEALLRDGSANWSPAGEKLQDNNARYTNDREQIRAFEQDFDSMWTRDDNTQVQ
jgi:phosphatidylserine/phosphatidylglycerophosphate/cardiolipin synthase-like enzyme